MSEIVIVTGASSGIGAATARLLGSQGASVVVNYMSSAALAEGVAEEVRAAGGKSRVGREQEARGNRGQQAGERPGARSGRVVVQTGHGRASWAREARATERAH